MVARASLARTSAAAAADATAGAAWLDALSALQPQTPSQSAAATRSDGRRTRAPRINPEFYSVFAGATRLRQGFGEAGCMRRPRQSRSSGARHASPLHELPLHPVQLAGHVFDDVASLEVIRQHVPRVGFDFEMRRERRLLV